MIDIQIHVPMAISSQKVSKEKECIPNCLNTELRERIYESYVVHYINGTRLCCAPPTCMVHHGAQVLYQFCQFRYLRP